MCAEPPPLTIRAYAADDEAMLSEWWAVRHPEAFPAALLPPLGVIVLDEDGPACVLFCYESYGVGVAFLELAISRPRMSLEHSTECFKKAVESCIYLAGKLAQPPGDFRFFRCFTDPGIARILGGMGFTVDSKPRIECGFINA